MSLEELKALLKHEFTVTLPCSGNSWLGYYSIDRASGTPWGEGAISTVTFGGPELRDILMNVGVADNLVEEVDMEHLWFMIWVYRWDEGKHIEKALNPYGDHRIIANDKWMVTSYHEIMDIILFVLSIRNVKWVQKIKVSNKKLKMHGNVDWMIKCYQIIL